MIGVFGIIGSFASILLLIEGDIFGFLFVGNLSIILFIIKTLEVNK